MNPKGYFLISGVIFLVVALVHLSRLISGWDVQIAGRMVPHWASVVGVLLSGGLSAWGFRLASRV